MNKNSKERVFISYPLEKTSFQVGLISAHLDLLITVFGEPDESGEDRHSLDENNKSLEFNIPDGIDDYEVDEAEFEDRLGAKEIVRDYEWIIKSKFDERSLGRIYGSFSDSQYCDSEKSNWIISVNSLPALSFNPLPLNQELLMENYTEFVDYLTRAIGKREGIKVDFFGPLLWR